MQIAKIYSIGYFWSLFFYVCVFLSQVADLCGLDLLKSQQRNATSKERFQRELSGNMNTYSEYLFFDNIFWFVFCVRWLLFLQARW